MVSQAGALALGGMLPGRPLVRLLPHAARERAGLQQRHRGHEGHLRRLPRRHRPRRPGPLAPVDPRHRADGQRAGHDVPGARHRGRGAPLRRVGGRRGRPARSTCASSRCRGSSASSRPRRRRCGAGRGTVVREEGDVVLVCTGPVLASQAHAVEDAALVLLPWLRDVDGDWLREVAGGRADRRARQPLGPRRPGRRGARRAAGRATSRSSASTASRPAAPTTRSCAPTGSTPRRCARGSECRVTTYLFWDIDGTLLTTARAGDLRARGGGRGGARRARSTSPRLQTAGLTDAEIALAIGATAATATATAAHCCAATSGCCPTALPRRQGHVLPERAREPRGAVRARRRGQHAADRQRRGRRRGQAAPLRPVGLLRDTGGAFSVEGSRPAVDRPPRPRAGRRARRRDAAGRADGRDRRHAARRLVRQGDRRPHAGGRQRPGLRPRGARGVRSVAGVRDAARAGHPAGAAGVARREAAEH